MMLLCSRINPTGYYTKLQYVKSKKNMVNIKVGKRKTIRVTKRRKWILTDWG